MHRVERRVTIPHPPIPIGIKNSPLGGLFNASYDYGIGVQRKSGVPFSAVSTPAPGYTHVFTAGHQGTDWVLQGNEAYFSYDRHDHEFRALWASSGGLVSFPDVIVNRLVYECLRFDCKVSESEGRPDLGIRLVVDDPSLSSADKEIEVYELPSLNGRFKAKPLSGEWQNYEIYTLSLVDQPRVGHTGASRIDTNEINKIVFFVNDSIISRSAKGTVWVRNVVFSTTPRTDQ